MRRVIAMAALATAVVASTMIVSVPVSAASVSCYRTVYVWTSSYGEAGPVAIPSAGSTAASTNCVLGVGNQGTAVRNLQTTLNKCYGPYGFVAHRFSSNLVVDGIFGTNTKNALKAAQSYEGITADGVYGPQTRNHLWFWMGIVDCNSLYLVNGQPVIA